jgi:hypothetical protein
MISRHGNSHAADPNEPVHADGRHRGNESPRGVAMQSPFTPARTQCRDNTVGAFDKSPQGGSIPAVPHDRGDRTPLRYPAIGAYQRPHLMPAKKKLI